jgi:hypothetical protein
MEKVLDVEAAGCVEGNREEGEDMNNPYDLHAWSKQYREEALREARTRHLERLLQASGEIGAYSPHEGKGARNMRRSVLVIAVVTTMVVSAFLSAPAAFASHEHYLLTPGTCVEDVASGQTSKGEGEGGYHKFHDNVHKGQPGMAAFGNPNNPVYVDRDSCPVQE